MRVIGAVALILGFASCVPVEERHREPLAPPNPKLLGCRAAACSQLWSDDASPKATYPRQVLVDIFGDGSCPLSLRV